MGEQTVTVWLIDWKNPGSNHFAIAEEVTVAGRNTKRPDLVLYVNGIALGVLELKRSTVSVSEGIRQNIDNQKAEFIQPFFATVQLVLAGNDTEGFALWRDRDPGEEMASLEGGRITHHRRRQPPPHELGRLCGKERLLDLVHDFIVFDAGTKKICRHNQYFGVRAAQARVERREGGIIWHTQGSGKSLTMVWLAKSIREHVASARVLLITDRTELDDQIESVFKGVGEDIRRTRSGSDLVRVLGARRGMARLLPDPQVRAWRRKATSTPSSRNSGRICPGTSARGASSSFSWTNATARSPGGSTIAMRELLPDAMLIGFTGDPAPQG